MKGLLVSEASAAKHASLARCAKARRVLSEDAVSSPILCSNMFSLVGYTLRMSRSM
jgi:hypothetical protein